MLVTDLDGTLLNSKGEVSLGNLRAIRRAAAQGIEVVVATGRSWIECREIAAMVAPAGHAITAGGAALHSVASGRCEDSVAVSHDLVQHCTESLTRHGHLAHLLKDPERAGYDYLLVGDAELDPASKWWFSIHPLATRSVPSLEDHEGGREGALAHVLRVGTVASATQLAEVSRQIRDEVGERLAIKHWPALVALGSAGADTHLLEIFDATVDKWTMVLRLCESRGLSPEDVVAVGDGLNDLRMLGSAGVSYAVANAEPLAAAAGRRRAPTNDEDALAFVVDEILGSSGP
jgi:hydroxymethylpyrimidine pyrophosphatase-like HAD family hydrolase